MRIIGETYRNLTSRPLISGGSALLLVWYISILTVVPIANYWRLGTVEASEAPVAKAVSMCTGMACSTENKGGGCCCTPDKSESTPSPSRAQISADCSMTGGWDFTNHRSPASHAPSFAHYAIPAFEPTSRSAASDSFIPYSLSYPIEHIPILQCA